MKGGYRPGAGRKKGFAAKSSEEGRKIFSEMLMREIEPIARALIERAKDGDVTAARELFDRSWGKATSATETVSATKQLVEFSSSWDGREPGWLMREYKERIERGEMQFENGVLVERGSGTA